MKQFLENSWKAVEVNLILTWSKDCVISSSEGEAKFAITETKLCAPLITLPTQDNAKLLQQLKQKNN